MIQLCGCAMIRSKPDLVFVTLVTIVAMGSGAHGQVLPPVPFPAENQFTQEKADLGKILFWDEQLSSDNTMACGTCHQSSAAGTDPRVGTNPGFDELFGTQDDIAGSPGVVTQDSDDEYLKSVLFALLPQATGRQAQPSVMAMYAPELFWDGRAGGTFFDPQTGEMLVSSGGALENQAVGPVLSSVEMAHQSRDWDAVIDKLVSARPMALATNLPADMQNVIADGASFPDLFTQAFGDSRITAGRIGMAIATYERTLVPDQTPFDEFAGGNASALTPQQLNGLNAFRGSTCNACHGGPQFTGNTFRNIGLRPIVEDPGRLGVTGNPTDGGRFKVPTLRNTGLRDRFMHNGQLSDINEVFDFYARRNGQVSFAQNRDVLLNNPIAFPPPVQGSIINFLVNGLTDPRVASEVFPFDQPSLYSELAMQNPQLIGSGTPGTNNRVPEMIADCPPNLGNTGFKIGIDNALGGADAWVAISTSPPSGGLVAQDELLGPITLEGVGAGNGFGTMPWAIPNDPSLDGQVWFMQWIVIDPSASGGVAVSQIAELTGFCSQHGLCINTCAPDFTFDGTLDVFDVFAFIQTFNASGLDADFTEDGLVDIFDVFAFIESFNAGCV